MSVVSTIMFGYLLNMYFLKEGRKGILEEGRKEGVLINSRKCINEQNRDAELSQSGTGETQHPFTAALGMSARASLLTSLNGTNANLDANS